MKRLPPDGAKTRARRLRSNPTEAEKAMWRILREGFPEARFRRQAPIRHYIADFVSHSAKLVIEVDGGQHSETADAARTAIIEAEGYRFIRFWNHDVLQNPHGVAAQITAKLPTP